MKKFQVNDYIELLLINDETVIYVNNRKFIQCKFLLLNIPVEEISSLDEIESVDEAAEKLDKSLEPFEGIGRSEEQKYELQSRTQNE